MSTPAKNVPWGASSTLGVAGGAAAALPLIIDALTDERIDPGLRKLLVIAAAGLLALVLVGRYAQSIVAQAKHDAPTVTTPGADLDELRAAVANLTRESRKKPILAPANALVSPIPSAAPPDVASASPSENTKPFSQDAAIERHFGDVQALSDDEAEDLAADVADVNEADFRHDGTPPPDTGDGEVANADRNSR
jgi:hypothetical protein